MNSFEWNLFWWESCMSSICLRCFLFQMYFMCVCCKCNDSIGRTCDRIFWINTSSDSSAQPPLLAFSSFVVSSFSIHTSQSWTTLYSNKNTAKKGKSNRIGSTCASTIFYFVFQVFEYFPCNEFCIWFVASVKRFEKKDSLWSRAQNPNERNLSAPVETVLNAHWLNGTLKFCIKFQCA